MTNRMPGFEQPNKDIDPLTTGVFYVRPVAPGMDTTYGTQANIDSTNREQFSGSSTNTSVKGGNSEHQTQDQPTSKGSNNGLTKALVGGLIGATLGTLAAALANKRTSQGLNHATKGIGQAAKTVGEGVNHAAQGVGQAVKSVSEGVNYAVVGGVAEAVKNTAQSAQQAVESAADAVKDSVRSDEVIDREDGISISDGIPTAYVLVPVEKERIIERTIIVESQMPTADEANLGSLEPEIGLNQDLSGESFFQADESISADEFPETGE